MVKGEPGRESTALVPEVDDDVEGEEGKVRGRDDRQYGHEVS
jgi:hypothetical protein